MKLFVILGILLNPGLKLHKPGTMLVVQGGTTAMVVDIGNWIEDSSWDEEGDCRKAALALNPNGTVMVQTVGARYFCKSI